MEYSARLGNLTDAQLQAAVDECGLGRLTGAVPVTSGLFGQNLLLRTDQGEFVLRGRPHYDWQLPTEAYFARRLHEATSAPVPWPYLVRPDSRVFDWPWGYAVMPRLPGLSLADPPVYQRLSGAQRSSLAAAQGRLLAEVHRLRHPVAGRYDPGADAVVPVPGGYLQRTVEQIEGTADRARRNGAHGEQEQRWLDDQVTELARPPGPPVLAAVMEDFNRNNMVATLDSDTVTVTGLFDLMTFHFGDPLADLPRQFAMYWEEPSGRSDLADQFVAAYLGAAGLVLDESAVRRARLYLIAERLLVWEYFHRPGQAAGPWEPGANLIRWLAPYLAGFETILTGAPPAAAGG